MVECEESPFFSSVEILPPYSRQNDIVSEGDSPTRNLYVISNACERSHAFEHLGGDSSLRLRYVQNDSVM